MRAVAWIAVLPLGCHPLPAPSAAPEPTPTAETPKPPAAPNPLPVETSSPTPPPATHTAPTEAFPASLVPVLITPLATCTGKVGPHPASEPDGYVNSYIEAHRLADEPELQRFLAEMSPGCFELPDSSNWFTSTRTVLALVLPYTTADRWRHQIEVGRAVHDGSQLHLESAIIGPNKTNGFMFGLTAFVAVESPINWTSVTVYAKPVNIAVPGGGEQLDEDEAPVPVPRPPPTPQ